MTPNSYCASLKLFGFPNCYPNHEEKVISKEIIILWGNTLNWMNFQISTTCRCFCSSEQLEFIPTKQYSTDDMYTITIKLDLRRGIVRLWCAWFLLLVEQISFKFSQRSCGENFKLKRLKRLNQKYSQEYFCNSIGSLNWIRNVFPIILDTFSK